MITGLDNYDSSNLNYSQKALRKQFHIRERESLSLLDYNTIHYVKVRPTETYLSSV